MSLEIHVSSLQFTCFPRVSGDEPVTIKQPPALPVFSPRERG